MTFPQRPKQLVLRKKEERRILAGHPWVYSNELQEVRGEPAIGDVVELVTAGGRSLGVGFYNPHSLISFRLLSAVVEPIDGAFFRTRIAAALDLRQRIYPGRTAYRLVHGEGDFLPGLVIDRFNSIAAVQTFSFGMDAFLPVICDILQELLGVSSVIERNESGMRTLEQLPVRKAFLRGSESQTVIEENGVRYTVDVLEGQKTGFFFDQRQNRASVAALSGGAEVLDCFCNDGGFSINAALAGATSVTGIDISSDAVARARANASMNGASACAFLEGDVFVVLGELARQERLFDLVVLDPPSFTRSRKTVPAARKGYRDLHRAALGVLRPGGILATASCSHHITPETFLSIVDETCREAGRTPQMLSWAGAAPDHPTLPAVPETRYLKFGVFRVR